MVELQLDDLKDNRLALKQELLKAFALLRINAIKKIQQGLQAEIKTAENEKNKERISELNGRFAQLSVEKVKFENLL